MIASTSTMEERTPILCIIGPTASGKSHRAVEEAIARNGEVISVDSRQVYRMLDIGTEKTSTDEMRGVPHHLIDVRDPRETYTAGDFVEDATRLIADISARGKLPILAGGTHFYFDALLNGLPENVPPNPGLRETLEQLTNEELYARIEVRDPERAHALDPHNRRRLLRALEITETLGKVPERTGGAEYDVTWIIVDPGADALRERLKERLEAALARGLVEEVRQVRAYVGDERLNELGLEYRIVGEYLRGERSEDTLVPALIARLSQYARRQRAWIRRLTASEDYTLPESP